MTLNTNALLIDARVHDLGDLTIRRVLPIARAGAVRRHVGPFVFLDHIGPIETEKPLFVSEHPHIGLATATYLFEGEILHKDSIGSEQVIRERELNLMTAGKWITHIEQGLTEEVHGLQFWIALPQEEVQCEPSFHHLEGTDLPLWTLGKDVICQLLMGEYQGKFAETPFPARAHFMVFDSASSKSHAVNLEIGERELGIYVAEGTVTTQDHGVIVAGQLLVLDPTFTGDQDGTSEPKVYPIELGPGTRLAVFGGDPLDGPRHMKWNYVASDEALIAQAEKKWKEMSENI